MKYTKIKSQSLKESCINQLKGKILSGEIKIGDFLPPERELAEAMGVSRSVINQSIMELEANGFVQVLPRRGNLVRDFRKNPTPQSIAVLMQYGGATFDYKIFTDLMALRLLIEGESAYLASLNEGGRGPFMKGMEKQLEKLEECIGDPTDIIFEYHYNLVQASGNGVYAMCFKGFESILKTLIHHRYADGNANLKEAVTFRKELLDIISSNDANAAKAKVSDILREGMDVLEQDYK